MHLCLSFSFHPPPLMSLQTTCAVYRIWGQWVAGYKGPVMGVEAPTIVFVTASATLKAQVSKAFRKLQVG